MTTLTLTQTNSRVTTFCINYLSGILLCYLGMFYYTELSDFHIRQYNASWQMQFVTWKFPVFFNTQNTLRLLFYVYAVALIPYYLVMGDKLSKSALALSAFSDLIQRKRLEHHQKIAVCALVLKLFFVPFIVNAFLIHCRELNYKSVDVVRYFMMDKFERPFFIKDITHTYLMLLMSVIYLMDVVPFLVGYLFDLDSMSNKIRSVETTAKGWFFCLICYPPFNTAFGNFVPTDVPEFSMEFPALGQAGFYLQYLFNFVGVSLMALYASASISLGWKASNLTSRGVVATGLYKYVRHPAYISKNLSWWCFAISFALHRYLTGQTFVFHLAALAVWTWFYYQRALTEELHMARTDPEYLTYMQDVPYRFIPKVL